MPQALAKCGFIVSLYSNQERWNDWGSDESFSFAGCDPFVVIQEQDAYLSVKQSIGTNRFDEVLFPYLDDALAMAWAAVLAAELLNTAAEAVVDLASPEWHPLARQAKDAASASVFVLIALTLALWCAALVSGG